MSDKLTGELASPEKIVWVYEGGKGETPVRYVRKGHCTRCGDCCRKSWGYERGSDKEYPSDTLPAKDLIGTEAIGLKVAENWDGYWVYWQRLDAPLTLGCLAFEEPNFCNHFKKDTWPELCRKWPIIPEDLTGYPNCGFYFEPLPVESA